MRLKKTFFNLARNLMKSWKLRNMIEGDLMCRICIPALKLPRKPKSNSEKRKKIMQTCPINPDTVTWLVTHQPSWEKYARTWRSFSCWSKPSHSTVRRQKTSFSSFFKSHLNNIFKRYEKSRKKRIPLWAKQLWRWQIYLKEKTHPPMNMFQRIFDSFCLNKLWTQTPRID